MKDTNKSKSHKPHKAKKPHKIPNTKAESSDSYEALLSSKDVEKYFHGKVEPEKSRKKPASYALRTAIQQTEENIKEAATTAYESRILLPDTELTLGKQNKKPNQEDDESDEEEDEAISAYRLSQKTIKANVDVNVARQSYNLQLSHFGPYIVNYSRNGRYMLLGGRKGHIAAIDCQNLSITREMQLNNSSTATTRQRINDITYLHNESLFAVAQTKYTYIYDNNGIEIHCLKRFDNVLKLQYLPYHFLLSSINANNYIKWLDVSTGEFVAGHNMSSANSGASNSSGCQILRQNPVNAVLLTGHNNGVVSMWSPNSSRALVSMLAHTAPLTDMAVDREGKYLTTAALDGYMKIWDLRTYRVLSSIKLSKPASALDISDKGLLAVSHSHRHIQIFNTLYTTSSQTTSANNSGAPFETYLHHELTHVINANNVSGASYLQNKQRKLSSVVIQNLKFRPFEDILAIGHSHGLSSIIVPGSGEAHFDSFESNPFINTKQRREQEIQQLLNKLPANMIALESDQLIGRVESAENNHEQSAATRKLMEIANARKDDKPEKKRMRGRNKISAKLRRKQKNVIDEQVLKLRAAQEQQQRERKQKQQPQVADNDALSRFAKK